MFCIWVFANSLLCGRLQNAPTQHTLKVIDYQIYILCQSFGTLTKFMMHKVYDAKAIFRLFGQPLFNSHELHEFSRIWDCIKLFTLYYLTNFHLTVNYFVNILRYKGVNQYIESPRSPEGGLSAKVSAYQL